jgi:SWI/SNF-related matrix-associated actin-dependent regulator of chromatin subfamily A-like protein 1
MRLEAPQIDESYLNNTIQPELFEKLYPYQREGVLFGIARGGKFMLGDDMGLGKTIQALAVAASFEDWPMLIVSTASTRNMWRDQIISNMPSVLVQDIRVLESSKDSIGDAKIVICSYTALDANLRKLELKDFKTVIFDESHSIKNYKSKQTQNAKRLGHKANRRILITGTPALSRPSELHSQLEIIDESFASYHQFTKRYCEGHNDRFGWNVAGSSFLDELDVILRKKFMIRRTKEEVLINDAALGAKSREKISLNVEKEAKRMKQLEANYNAEQKKAARREILLTWFSETSKIKSDAVW